MRSAPVESWRYLPNTPESAPIPSGCALDLEFIKIRADSQAEAPRTTTLDFNLYSFRSILDTKETPLALPVSSVVTLRTME